MTTYEEIVAMLNDPSNADKVCGIGILVEFPLSRPRFESSGVLVVERGRRSKKPWKLRRVSIVIMLKSEDSQIEPVRVSKIDWKNLTPIKERESKGWRILIWGERVCSVIQKFWRRLTFRESSELPEGYSFYCSNRVIKIDNCKGTFKYWYVKSDKYDSLWDIDSVKSSFWSLCGQIEKSINKSLENFGFLSPCEDLEWLEMRFREHMPEPHKTKALAARKNKSNEKISNIQEKKSKLEQQITLLENYLFEAKNEKRPRQRWLWKIVNSQIFVDIFTAIAVSASVFIAIFMFVFSSTVLSTNIGPALILFWAIIFGSKKYYKRFSRPMPKWSTRYSRSEISRELTTEKHYLNKK